MPRPAPVTIATGGCSVPAALIDSHLALTYSLAQTVTIMNSQVFREYDIRGIVANDFDDAFVVDLGSGYATLLHQAGKKSITLGRDCSLSSDSLGDRLAEGVLAAGIDVVDVGVVP